MSSLTPRRAREHQQLGNFLVYVLGFLGIAVIVAAVLRNEARKKESRRRRIEHGDHDADRNARQRITAP